MSLSTHRHQPHWTRIWGHALLHTSPSDWGYYRDSVALISGGTAINYQKLTDSSGKPYSTSRAELGEIFAHGTLWRVD